MVEVLGPQVVADVDHGLPREEADRLGLDPQKPQPVGLEGGDALRGQEAVVGGVGADGEKIGVGELAHGVTLPSVSVRG